MLKTPNVPMMNGLEKIELSLAGLTFGARGLNELCIPCIRMAVKLVMKQCSFNE